MKGIMRELDGRSVPLLRRWLAGRTNSERATLARLWSLPEASALVPDTLADALLQPAVVEQLLAALGPHERAALERVQSYGGTIPAAVLEREFGGVRVHDDYPNPRSYLLALEQPPTPTERLYMLALLQLGGVGANRAYVVPSDLLALLPTVPLRDQTLCLPACAAPPDLAAGDARVIERDLLTIIALAQDGQLEVIPSGGLNKASLLRLARQWDKHAKLQGTSREEHWPFIKFLRCVGIGASLLRVGADARLRPTRAALEWMQRPALERARQLLDGWIASEWDELVSFVGLKVQRGYFRDLPRTKRTILRLIAQAPLGEWVALDDFVGAVKQTEPDFARPDGQYDTWSLVDYYRQSLDGFVHWDDVEGQQLRGIAGGTLRWLGLTDLGMRGKEPLSFRLNPLGAALLDRASAPPDPPTEPLVIQPNFEVIAPTYASPYARFQLGRIAERNGEDDTEIYKLTKKSVQIALERGISLEDLLHFLAEQSTHALPQNVAVTLAEWAGQHGQVALRRGVLLESTDATVLERIKNDRRVKLPLVEQLADTTWLLREGDVPELAERLRKAGYGLTGDSDNPRAPLKEHDLTILFAALETYVHTCAALGIEGDASGALRQRVARLLPEKQLHRAYQSSHDVIKRLKERLGRDEERL
jgi:Helicase conserved C-terminal domain